MTGNGASDPAAGVGLAGEEHPEPGPLELLGGGPVFLTALGFGGVDQIGR